MRLPSIVHPGGIRCRTPPKPCREIGTVPRPELASSIVTAVPASSDSTLFAMLAHRTLYVEGLPKLPCGESDFPFIWLAGDFCSWVPTRPPRATQLGNYDILSKIAEGGMGTVYKADNRVTGADRRRQGHRRRRRPRTPSCSSGSSSEFKAAKLLDHPNVVRALDYCGTGPHAVPGDGVRGRRVARPADRARRARCPRPRRSGSSPRCARGSNGATSRGSSTAT